MQTDIGDANGIEDLFRRLDASLVQLKLTAELDILGSNAGLGTFRDLEATSVKQFDATFQTNVRGTFFVLGGSGYQCRSSERSGNRGSSFSTIPLSGGSADPWKSRTLWNSLSPGQVGG